MKRPAVHLVGFALLYLPALSDGYFVAHAQGGRPTQVLKDRGILRVKGSSSCWFLEDEAVVLRKFRAVKGLAVQWDAAQSAQQELITGRQGPGALIEDFRTQIGLLDQRINAMEQELAGLGPSVGNSTVDRWHNLLVQERNAMVLEQGRLRGVISGLSGQGGQLHEQMRQFYEEVARVQASYDRAVQELREMVDTIRKSYDKLAKKEEVARALAALSSSSKAKQRFGPSKDLQGVINWLERSDKPVPRRSPRTPPRKKARR
jgi:hypothetical protein